ncbi:serine hydrolase [Streptomyces asoensis]|uniref:serine hydrolase n=1 Tax=Streptomyces asoensis TaxID=249586 RepID=UPI003789822A
MRIPTCVFSSTAEPAVRDGHAVDRFVQVASLTKVVTGTALVQMATAGVLALDDPVERWLDPNRRLLAPGRAGRPRRPWTMTGAILPAGGLWATPRAAADLVVRLLVERRLGYPAPSWQTAGPLHWHNGAVRHASVFTAATDDGHWVMIHQLNAPPDHTDRTGIALLQGARTPS